MELKSTDEIYRSKLYMLNKDNEWINQALGMPSIENSLQRENYELKFKSEENQLEVYDMEITKESIFEHKEDNIISWFHPLKNVYMALSFQSEKGAHNFWEKIQEINFDHAVNNLECLNEESFLEQDYFYSFKADDVHVPEPTSENLSQLSKTISEAMDFGKKLQISRFFVNYENYLESLQKLFNEAEEKSDLDSISKILLIMKSLIMFSETSLVYLLMGDKYYLFVFGVLEYDPEVYQRTDITHREYFQKIVKFHEIAKIQNNQILNIIHLNYRLSYLRDNALGFFLDERAVSLITQMIYNIYGEIIKFIKSNKEFVESLFVNLKKNDIMALKLIYEIFSVSKILEIDKINLIQTFEESDFFSIIEENLLSIFHDESQVRQQKDQMNYLFETILLILQIRPILFKKYVTSEEQKKKNYPLINFLCAQILKKDDENLIILSAEILSYLLENDTLVNKMGNSQQIILNPHPQEIFIEFCLGKLLTVLTNKEELKKNNNNLSLKLIFGLIGNISKIINEKIKTFWLYYSEFSSIFSIFKYKNDKEVIMSCLKSFKSFIILNVKEINILLEKPLSEIFDFFLSLSFYKKNLIFSLILEIFKIVYQEKILNLMNTLNVALKNCSSVTHKYFLTKCFESFKLLNPFLKNGTMQESNENTTGFFENSSKFSPKESAEDNSINKKGLQIVVKSNTLAKSNDIPRKKHDQIILIKRKKLVDYDEDENENENENEDDNENNIEFKECNFIHFITSLNFKQLSHWVQKKTN